MIKTITSDTLKYLVASNIAIPHCFTTRLGGVSGDIFASLNLGMHRGDDPANVAENYRILANALGFDLDKLVMCQQTHSDTVHAVTEKDALGIDHHIYPQRDAIITNTPGVALWVFTADCTPVLLHDPVTGAVGAVHAGWRGTASQLAAKTVQAMVDTYGCKPENIHAAIGPNIGACCFETDRDVPDAMVRSYGDDALAFISQKGHKYHLNLKELNALALKNAGVRSIEISTDCTACLPDRYWSHRVTGGNRGSQGALILCKEV